MYVCVCVGVCVCCERLLCVQHAIRRAPPVRAPPHTARHALAPAIFLVQPASVKTAVRPTSMLKRRHTHADLVLTGVASALRVRTSRLVAKDAAAARMGATSPLLHKLGCSWRQTRGLRCDCERVRKHARDVCDLKAQGRHGGMNTGCCLNPLYMCERVRVRVCSFVLMSAFVYGAHQPNGDKGRSHIDRRRERRNNAAGAKRALNRLTALRC